MTSRQKFCRVAAFTLHVQPNAAQLRVFIVEKAVLMDAGSVIMLMVMTVFRFFCF